MSQSLSYLIQRLKPYWLDAAVAALGIELNRIIHFPANFDPAEFYDKDEAGLIAALASASSGSSILIPPVGLTLTGVVTIPDDIGIYGRDKTYTIIEDYGFILGTNSYLANLNITISRASAGDIIGIEGPVTGTGYVEMCNVFVTNSGAGDALGVSAENGLVIGNGEIHVKDCYLNAVASGGGDGYAGRSSAGYLKVFHSRVYGSTDRFITA